MKDHSLKALRLSRVVAFVLVINRAWACETVCMNRVGNAVTTYRAQAIAARILKGAGVQVEFKEDNVHACEALRNAIVITMSEQTRATDHPGSLAYAKPYEQTHIVVFYDRVLADFRPAGVPSLLGHVLAHEIGHILQGVEHHSSMGLMKKKWDYRDYLDMQRHPLRFTDEDLLLIREGLKNRASTQPRSPCHELPTIGEVGTKTTNTDLVPD